MYEESRRFSWTSLFIKIIIVIIFILFTIWLLSLSTKNATKGLSNSLNVLTDGIFSENIDRMKEVGKSYFTTERLPEKVGDVKTLTLASMYDKNLILEVKDKNGNACSAKNSYVSVEKMETEYQMKVYLECGSESNYINVPMGCYNYCSTDICEKKSNDNTNSAIEYQYSKTTGGSWTGYGNWSEWSKTVVTNTNYRQVDTKTVREDYSYDKSVTESKYTRDAVCPSVDGYTLKSNSNGVCTYTKTIVDTKNPTCPSVSGYTNTGRNGNTCSYSTSTSSTTDPTCPSVSGYTLTGRNGNTCSYSTSTSSTSNPTCPSVSGYTNTGRSGNTCNYSKTITDTKSPVCPSVSGYTNTGRSGFTCSYSKCYKVAVGTKIVSSCTGCAKEVQTIYETRCDYTSRTASCPSGTVKSGNACSMSTTSTTTRTATCASGTLSNGVCVTSGTATTTRTAVCASGTLSNGKCVVSGTATTTRTATCPSGYDLKNGICAKDNVYTLTRDASCPTDERRDGGKCYKDIITTQRVTDVRDVTYYKYRTRSYTGGTTDYKWSRSNNDKSLINAGYKLTGKTRTIEGGK